MASPRFQVLLDTQPTVTQRRMSAQSLAATLPVAWRLLGSNHRELGRSAVLFSSVPDCLLAIETIRGGLDELTSAVLADTGACFWFWAAYHQTVPVVVSSRFYQRRRESSEGLRRTLEKIADADPEAEVMRTRRTRRSDWGKSPLMLRRAAPIIDLRDRPHIPPIVLDTPASDPSVDSEHPPLRDVLEPQMPARRGSRPR